MHAAELAQDPQGTRLTNLNAAQPMAGFMGHLRLNGFRLGLTEAQAGLSLVSHLGAENAMACRTGLKILLCSGHEDWARFDELFEAFWFQRGRTRERVQTATNNNVSDLRSEVWQSHFEGQSGASGTLDRVSESGEEDEEVDVSDEAKGRLIASKTDTVRRTDLRHMSDPAEIAEAERIALRLARAMRYRLSRRYKPDLGGKRIDLRKTIRANLSKGGDPVTLIGKSRPHRPVEIVLFVDVSGSMEAYTRYFLQFVIGLVSAWPKSDAFLFHTRLVHVTDAVRERDPTKAMAKLSLVANGMGGGTKLGDCLKQFNDRYAKSCLNSRTVFVVFSDGYDTGEPDNLTREVERLKMRASRLVWLNPLIGWQDYEPITAAMAAILPHIDKFAPAHTLDTLANIETELARI